MRRHPRRQIMIDQKVQGLLIHRVVRYWLTCLGSVTIFVWCYLVWTESPHRLQVPMPKLLAALVPPLLGTLFILPCVIADLIRVTARFTGPIHSLRNAIRLILLGDRIEPLQCRDGDYWGDLIDRFNELAARRR